MIYDMPESKMADLVCRCVDYGSLAPVLYRYRAFDQNTESSLNVGNQMFSIPLKFNDPFDCQISDRGEFTNDELLNYLTGAGLSNEEASTILLRNAQLQGEMLPELVALSRNKMMHSVGMLCLSKRADSILMWSHYAKSHEGYVLGFTVKNDPIFFAAPYNVQYEEKYPEFSYIKKPTDILPKVMGTKSKEWEYEQEVRIIKHGPGLYPFHKKCLTEVILGCRVSNENVVLMAQLLGSDEYRHVKIKQAKISHSQFVLEIENISV